MSQQDLMEILFFIFSGFVFLFCVAVLFVLFKYRPEEPTFLIRPLAKGLAKMYLGVSLIIIIAYIFL